jgi:ParB family chromosome partitioning protein
MSNKLKTIPLCQLKRSAANIRKTGRNAEIEQLAASIAANGLLENLIVKPCDGKTPTYEVVAGGRRLAALKLLAKRKMLDREHGVPCLVLTNGTSGTEASLAENFVRVPAHPADQFEAFAGLVHKGTQADDIAARFGVTPAFVQQRLKLAAVSPRLIAEYRAGAMTLEQLTAFTLCTDHNVQEEVWFERPYADMPADLIRRHLTKTQVEGNDRRARFVGAQAYEAAGGTILRDLFDAEDQGYFADGQLLDRLVAEKLEVAAHAVRAEGWQWVEVQADGDYLRSGHFGRAATAEVTLSEPEEARLRELSDRYDALVESLEEDSDEASLEEADRLEAELADLQARKQHWPDEEKARAGAIISLDLDGALQVTRGLIKPDASGHSVQNGNGVIRKKPERRNGYSDSVLLELSAHRTAALREMLAAQPETALLALLHALVDQLFHHGAPDSCLRIVANVVALDRAFESVAESTTAQAFRARHQAFEEGLPARDQVWDWLAALDPSERSKLLAHCVGMTVDALDRPSEKDKQFLASKLALATGLDMRKWWQPTRENFLGRLTKHEILSAVSEGVSQQATWRLAALKKERMAKEAEKLLAQTAWLPAPLRTGAPATEA